MVCQRVADAGGELGFGDASLEVAGCYVGWSVVDHHHAETWIKATALIGVGRQDSSAIVLGFR